MSLVKIVCPCTKIDCPFHDQSGDGRDWCDNEGDPSTYERCPIPNKMKKEFLKRAREEGEKESVDRALKILKRIK